MSVNMFLESSDEQAVAIQNMCQAHISEMEKVKDAIAQFTAETVLKGQAYDAAKRYFETTYVPLAEGFILIAEALQKAAKKLPEEYRTEVDENSLQEYVLRDQIRHLGDLIEEGNMCLAPSALVLSDTSLNVNPFLPFYGDQKREIQEKLDKLMAYDVTSASLFSEVESLIASVEVGLKEVSSGSGFNAETGTFNTASPETPAWADAIQKKYEKYSTVTKNIVLAGGYASTLNVARAETIASSKKIKGGTWHNSSVKSTKSGLKTWKQVNGDVGRFKSVKAARKVDKFVNGAGELSKGFPKSIGALGGAGAILDGATTYMARKDEYGEVSATVDGVVHTGTAVGSIYAGAAIGSLIPIPVVGTVAGAAGGYLINGVANTLYDGFAHGTWNLDNFKLW
ncbi:hypothetical protein HB825_15785 [Listeria booriae]|uniref:T7SS effector LXG polymorphic toxin n=1 Tax=Listeria booriae TaxID=1552123 RepID=UPI00164DB0D5|nr:T7SS effector LXG polymorphic toxin [Listeria booriae]MBC6136299.1 hypothetical protein [Listeria booriae]